MLTIGEFSRLSRVSTRMLRYYDSLGLLCPKALGENGYRYYEQTQLGVIGQIKRLSAYGFPLSEVRELLLLPETELKQRLSNRREGLYRQLDELRERLRRLEADILQMEGNVMSQSLYHVILMDDPEQKVFSIRRSVGVTEYHELFQQLRRKAEAMGLRQAGPIQMLYHDKEFSHECSDVEVQMVVSQNAPGVVIKPAHTCAAVTHRGSYDGLHNAYEAICDWLSQHPEYRVCGPAMDRYLNDPDQTAPADLETGVLFPVEMA